MKNTLIFKSFILLLLSGWSFTSSAQTITISHQTSGPFYIGEVYPVSWTQSGLASNNVVISYSTNNGGSWQSIDTVDKNSSPFDMPIVNTPTLQGRFRVSESGNPTVAGISAAPFQIKLPVYTLTSFTGGQSVTGCTTQNVNWTLEGIATNVVLELSPDGGATWLPAVEDIPAVPGSNSYAWSVANISSANARIRIRKSQDFIGGGLIGSGNGGNFTITKNNSLPGITVTFPNGGESFTPFTT